MGYLYGANWTRESLDKQGNVIFTEVGNTASGIIETSIVDKIRLTFQMTADNGDDFFNKRIVINQRLFSDLSGSFPTGGNIGFEVVTANGAGIFPVVMNANSFNEMNRNFEAAFQVISATTAEVNITFYITADVKTFIPHQSDNLLRFLGTSIGGEYMEDEPSTIYNNNHPNTAVEFYTKIKPLNSPQYVTVQNASGEPVFKLKTWARWYGRNLGSSDWEIATSQFNVYDSTGAIIASKQRNLIAPYDTNYDANFTELSNKLTTFGVNTLEFLILGSISKDMEAVKVFLIKESEILNNSDFLTDYDYLSSQIATTAVAGVVTLDGAIQTPTNFQDFSGLAYLVEFDVDGAQLDYGAEYRAGVVLYDIDGEATFSTISHKLIACALPECVPDLKCFLGNYFEEKETSKGIFAYHERVSSRIEIDKTSLEVCFQASGLDFVFDRDIQTVSMYLGTERANENSFSDLESVNYDLIVSYLNAGGLILTAANADDYGITDTAAILDVYGSFRISEDIDTVASFIIPVKWELTFVLKMPDGSFQPYTVRHYKSISARSWSTGIEFKYYEAEVYPAQKVEILNICDKDKIAVEVCLDASFVGNYDFIANLYKQINNTFGDTNNNLIGEHETTPPQALLQQLQENELLNVPTGNNGLSIFSFCVDTSRFVIGQKYVVDGILRKN